MLEHHCIPLHWNKCWNISFSSPPLPTAFLHPNCAVSHVSLIIFPLTVLRMLLCLHLLKVVVLPSHTILKNLSITAGSSSQPEIEMFRSCLLCPCYRTSRQQPSIYSVYHFSAHNAHIRCPCESQGSILFSCSQQ